MVPVSSPPAPPERRAGAPLVLGARALAAAADLPLTVRVDRRDRRVTVLDRGERFSYSLGARGAAGFGWTERARDAGGLPLSTPVGAFEVMAVVDAAGWAEGVALLTEAALPSVANRESRRSLRRQVARGRKLEVVSVRAFQVALVRRVIAGEDLSGMCQRGGFMSATTGRADTTWFKRRIGLEPNVCSRTGKRRFARVVAYDLAVRYAAALELDPHELGI